MGGSAIEAGNAALKIGDWEAAREAFRPAAEEGDPEAWWGLGMLGFLASDGALAFDGFERAYHLYRDTRRPRDAAMAAMFLANSTYDFRGEPAVASGWLKRAERLLDGLEPGAEHAWLDIWMGNLALMGDNDVVRAEELATRAIGVARQAGDMDAEMLGLSLQGLALVSRGDLAGGMARLDEAATATIAGDVDDPNAAFMTVCNLIEACSRVFDYERAAQWCSRVRDYCGERNLTVWYSVCRPNYARVLVWRGDWAGAETELTEAATAIAELRPPLVAESLVRLAELRVRQGRFDEAEELFRRTEGDSLSLPGRAWLALERDDPQAAVDLAERFLRSRPAEDRSACAQVYEVFIRASLATGDREGARAMVAQIGETAEMIATAPVRASAAFAAGLVALDVGEPRHAREALEDALDLFGRAGATFDLARVRLELARALHALGRPAQAAESASVAHEALQRLGAGPNAARAADFLAALGVETGDAAGDGRGEFTLREREILGLMARGFSNHEIADRLVISIRTVERHVSNIYQKLGVSGPAARAAAVAHALGQEFGD